MANGAVVDGYLRKAKITEDELRQKLRMAGIHRYSEVAAVILERSGSVSVLRQGDTIAPELLSDVQGHELLAPEHVRP